MARGYQYWALGHVHQRELRGTDPVVAFSGNLQGRRIREAGAKGCWLVTVDDSQTAREQPMTIPKSLQNHIYSLLYNTRNKNKRFDNGAGHWRIL